MLHHDQQLRLNETEQLFVEALFGVRLPPSYGRFEGIETARTLAYPMQAKSANSSGCWNWFKPGDQRRDSGEPSLIAGITRAISDNLRVDPGRIFIAGLSAGGAAAAIVGNAYPDIYAAIGVHSGLPAGVANDLTSALAAMRQGNARTSKIIDQPMVPTIVFHGDQDSTVHPSNGAHIIEQIRAGQVEELRVVSERGTSAGRRTFTRTGHLNAKDRTVMEMWVVHGAGHAWSGGSPAGSYTDPLGPHASREMVHFFLNATNPRE